MAQLVGLQVIEIIERIQRLAAQAAIHSWRIADVENRIAFAAALHALKHRGDEPGAPATLAATGLHAAADENDKSRQVVVFRAESVSNP